MSITLVRKSQIRPLNIIRSDINTTTSGSALITKVIAGTGLTLSSSTGINSGTGDVTIALSIASASVLGGVKIGSGLSIAVDGTISVISTSTTWGSITGNLPSQLDLQTALNAKYNNPTGTTSQYIDGTGAYRSFPTFLSSNSISHEVKAGVAINKGQAVYVTSADGTNMIVGLASNSSEATSSKTMGLLDATVSTNGFARVVTEGLLAGLNTNGANAGDPVWLGTGGNLIYGLANKPYAPAHLVFIGIVTRANSSNGEIFIKVQNGFEFGELHDYVQNGVQDNFVISYEASTSLYKPKSIATLLGYTAANDANVVHKTGAESIAGIKTFSDTTQSTSVSSGAVVVSGGVGITKNLYVGGDINISGNLTIGGTNTIINAQNLSVSDNMIYLNNGIETTITNVVANGTTIVYTTQQVHNYSIGMVVTISGVTPAGFNLNNQAITAVGTNSFTIASSVTGSYVSGGTARAKSSANPDLGFAGGYNDGTYGHAGLFRDATDNVWKFFKGYTPEPDASPFIDTSHASFAYADLRAFNITGNSFVKLGGTSSQFLKADGSIDSSAYVPITGASYIQSTGRSTSWGSTNGTSTGALNAIMGTSTSATWLISGTSAGVFRGGIQLLDVGGTIRFYEGANFFSFSSNTITATTFSGALSGNATTSTSLATARTLTIGSTGKTFNGSADVTWTLAEIGVLNTVLTPYVVGTNTAVTTSDTIETAIEKLQGQINARLSVESDTLATVTGRGATTSAAISITNATATASASTGALVVSGGVGVAGSVFIGSNLTTGGLTMGQGITGQNIYLNIQNPGIGYGNGFNFVRGTDSAGIRVIETSNDNTLYEMWMADNPDGGDMMQWRWDDWQNTNGVMVPLQSSGKTSRYVAETHNFYGTLYQSPSAFYTTSNFGGINGSDRQLLFNVVGKLRNVGSTIDITNLNVSGYNSTSGNLFWIKLDSATTFAWGYGSPSSVPNTAGIALSTSEVTLSNGIKVTFSATTGAIGDTFAARVFKAPTNTFGVTTVTGTLTATTFVKSGGTSSQFLKADGSVDSSAYITSSALTGYATQSWVTSQGYLSVETDTLATVTGRGAITSSAVTINNTLTVNNSSHYDSTQFSLDINGGLLVKNSGKTAQFVLINANPASGGNAGFVVHTVGGTTTTSYVDIQGYYGASIAGSTTLRLNALGGAVTINGNTAYHAGNLTNLNQLANGPGYITSYTETDPTVPSHVKSITTTNISNWNTAFGWGNHASQGYLTSVTNISGYAGTLNREDNRTISPSELTAGQMKFGFTSWNNNNSTPYADFIHMRSYTDASGGSDNLIMFKKTGIGMRIWQQTWGSSTAYSGFVDVWTTGNFTQTDVDNWNTAYSWGNHTSGGYLTSAIAATTYVSLTGSYTNPSWITNLNYSKITGGTASQFLKADGTVDSNIYALDSAVVHLTGNETVAGVKTFTNTGNSQTNGVRFINNGVAASFSLYTNNSDAGYGVWTTNGGSGTGLYSQNSGTGNAIVAENVAPNGIALKARNQFGGKGIELTNEGAGLGLIINNLTAATGMPFSIQKNGTNKFTINDAGDATATKFVKSGGTSAQYLMADGTVSTGPNLAGYLPLTGGTLTGVLNGTRLSFTQSSAFDTLYAYNGSVGATAISGGAANGTGGYFVNNSTTYPVLKLLGLSGTTLIEGRSTSDAIIFSVTSTGIVTGSSFVKSGGTAAQILAANGTVITAGTGITISGGTISASAVGGVSSFNTRTGAITLTLSDVTTALGYTPYNSSNPSSYISSYTETDTFASVTGRGATTSTPITITGTEGREVAVYMPSSYTTNDLVSGHEYGWYSDHWRLGMTRSGAAAGADFVVQWNGARKLSLSNAGDIIVTGTVTEQSSKRYKENIIDLEPISEKVNKLRPVRYNKIGFAEQEIGLIAEEVGELFPEFVNYNDAGQAESLNYTRLSVLLLQTVKELSDKIKKLETK